MALAPIWTDFQTQAQLSDQQLAQFQKYTHLLQDWNQRTNLTRISSTPQIILDHYLDSLSLGQFMDLTGPLTIVDVGAGAGFPGVPLKIKYPQLRLILIEVNHKKIEFLQAVIDELALEQVEIYDQDWRNFLRHTDDHVDLFCARASLQPIELGRVFKASCRYRTAKLVYWAAAHWTAPQALQSLVGLTQLEWRYRVGEKPRKLVCWAVKPSAREESDAKKSLS